MPICVVVIPLSPISDNILPYQSRYVQYSHSCSARKSYDAPWRAIYCKGEPILHVLFCCFDESLRIFLSVITQFYGVIYRLTVNDCISHSP